MIKEWKKEEEGKVKESREREGNQGVERPGKGREKGKVVITKGMEERGGGKRKEVANVAKRIKERKKERGVKAGKAKCEEGR